LPWPEEDEEASYAKNKKEDEALEQSALQHSTPITQVRRPCSVRTPIASTTTSPVMARVIAMAIATAQGRGMVVPGSHWLDARAKGPKSRSGCGPGRGPRVGPGVYRVKNHLKKCAGGWYSPIYLSY